MKLSNFTDLQTWAVEQWGDAELGDSRRTDRAIVVGAALGANPAASLPNIMEGWNEVRAAYRLFAEAEVTHSELIKPHTTATKARAKNSSQKVVLFIQDTSELDYTKARNIEGLGHIGDGRGRGIMLHNCLAVVPVPGNPEILGLAGQIPWVRSHQSPNLEIENISQELLRTESEGEIWSEMVESIGEAPAVNSMWVSVGDRGSDIFSYIRRTTALHWYCLLRVTQNRVITKPDATKGHLKAFSRSLEPMALKTIVLRGRNGEPKREVDLQVAWSPLIIQPPATGNERKQQPIKGWCIRAWSVEGDLEWILFTTVPVTDANSALIQLDWYACRWLIEEYHKCLKTGCAIEKRQLNSANALVTLLGFFAVVAVRLLQLRQISRSHPQLPAQHFVPPIMLNILVARLGLLSKNLSIGEFWKYVARLGGFLGRKNDGLPGWQTLWRGFSRLMDMCWAADFTTPSFEKCW